ncbi:MAG: RadC family protein [Clostridia bacterium]|nr:RadC family protein [Clostridia bacterium]
MAEHLHDGHRDRVKDKFLANDGFPKGTPDHEMLELLLFYSIPRKDTNDIAHELISTFGSLAGVLKASADELMQVKGITKNSAVLIKSILELSHRYNDIVKSKASIFASTEEIGTYLLGQYAGVTDEVMTVLSVNGNGEMFSFDEVMRGDISRVGLSTRKIIEIVLRTKATSVILAHNHPSGIALPSEGDLTATVTVKNALEHIGVNLLDHFIVVEGDFVSLAISEKFKDLFE